MKYNQLVSEDFTTQSGTPVEKELEELCLQCMTGNPPGSDFCHKCGAPLSSYAATGPFESLFAEGHVYRRAAEHPQRLIVVLGIWLIFGMISLAGAATAFMSWQEGGVGGVFTGLGMLLISVLLIGKTTNNYFKRKVAKTDANG